jgi:dTDP-glucose 4,6-dehydratase
MIHNALHAKPMPVYGDGQQIRDWLHVDDHCHALRAVLDRGRIGESYNIGGRSELSNMAVVEAICRNLDIFRPRAGGQPYTSLITHVRDRPGHDRRYAIDDSKISGELGWKPSIAFDEGVRQTVQWYLDHEDWVQSVVSGAYRRSAQGNYSASTEFVARAVA